MVDFDEIIKVQKDIYRTFSMILSANGKVDKKNDVSNFDSGSLWIEIFLGSAFAVKYVADIISIIYRAKALSKQDKLLERRMKELDFQEDIKHKIKEKLSNAFNTDLNRQLEEYSTDIENGVNTDPEMFSRLFSATKELFNLIESGNTFEVTEKSISEGIKQIPKNGEMIEELKKLGHDQDNIKE